MAHERAKDMLLRATTLPERAKAVHVAIAWGMPLSEIEDFLDNLDATTTLATTPQRLPTPAAASDVPARATVGSPVKSRLTRAPWVSVPAALAASLLLAATLGGVWIYRLTAGSASRPVYVAELCGSANAQWQEQGRPDADGRLPQGQRLVLTSGLAEIAFANGAHVILEGPAEFEPLSPGGGLLSHGQLSARVPPAARGFVVRAPDAAVVDLGTEFGIAVDQGKLSDVEVFAGRVEVGLDDEPTGAKQAVRAGKAIHVWAPTANSRPLVETAAAGLLHFVRSLPLAEKPAGAVAPVDAAPAKRFNVPEAGRTKGTFYFFSCGRCKGPIE